MRFPKTPGWGGVGWGEVGERMRGEAEKRTKKEKREI
jgi:hypothetical protein